jgi:hypothetical protein
VPAAARQQRSYSNPFDSVNEDSFGVSSSNHSSSGNDALMTLQALAAAELALVPTAATTTSSSSSGSASTGGAVVKQHTAIIAETTAGAATAAAGTASSASLTTSSSGAPTVEDTSPTAVTASNSVLTDTTVSKKSGHKRGTKSVAFADEAFHAAWNATEFSEWGSSAETGSSQTGSKTESTADSTISAVAGSDEPDQSNKFRSAVRHSVTWCDEAARQVAESAGRKLRRTMSDAK